MPNISSGNLITTHEITISIMVITTHYKFYVIRVRPFTALHR